MMWEWEQEMWLHGGWLPPPRTRPQNLGESGKALAIELASMGAAELAGGLIAAARLLRGLVVAAEGVGAMSRVLPASRLAELGAQEGTVVLGHFTRPAPLGAIHETLPILEDAAAQLGGRTLSSLPANMAAIAPELQAATRIVFFTSPGMRGLTAAEMALIQSKSELLARTIFIFGGL